MDVVLDANIFVSSLISSRGNPRKLVQRWEEGDFEVLVSAPIIEEVGRVLRYPRIARRHRQDEEAILRFLKLLSTEAVVVEPGEKLDVLKEDESDNRYLECALTGKAKYIITGDRHLLELGEYHGIVILPPAAFVTLLQLESR